MNQSEISGDINGPISASEAMHVGNDLAVMQSLDVPNAPITSVLENSELINNTESFLDILNAPLPFDKDQKRFQIADSLLQELYDAKKSGDTEPAIRSSLSPDIIEPDFLSQITDTMSQVQNSIEDEQLREAMKVFVARAEELKNSSGPRAENGTE